MSLALQVKLLRIIEYGEFSPVGAEETKTCDVRIVAASKQAPGNLVKVGKFREDLYYRLNVIRIKLPPLRERKEDILLLVEHFLKNIAEQTRKKVLRLSFAARQALQNHSYPGNVRELENIIRRATILCHGTTIELEHLPEELQEIGPTGHLKEGQLSTFKQAKEQVIADFERRYLQQALDEGNGVIKKAAEFAGMHTKNFHQKLVKYDLHLKKTKRNRAD